MRQNFEGRKSLSRLDGNLPETLVMILKLPHFPFWWPFPAQTAVTCSDVFLNDTIRRFWSPLTQKSFCSEGQETLSSSHHGSWTSLALTSCILNWHPKNQSNSWIPWWLALHPFSGFQWLHCGPHGLHFFLCTQIVYNTQWVLVLLAIHRCSAK